MVMDEERKEQKHKKAKTETQLDCGSYRETVSAGIRIEQEMTRICFSCEPDENGEGGFRRRRSLYLTPTISVSTMNRRRSKRITTSNTASSGLTDIRSPPTPEISKYR